MLNIPTDCKPVGYLALINMFKIKVIPHYRYSYVTSKGSGQIIREDGHEYHIYSKAYAVADENNHFSHIEFALKHEGVNLEILGKIFEQIPKAAVEKYVKSHPTGKYSRIVWFLYETLIEKQLAISNVSQGGYVNVLDEKKYYTSMSKPSKRHRVNDNLLGDRRFCPMVRRTGELNRFEDRQFDKIAEDLVEKFDSFIISRAAHYLYTKETMSSYEIERERPNKKRLTRFVGLLKEAAALKTLDKNKLIELQNSIVDSRFIDKDYRDTQNYVGESLNAYRQKIYYIAPKPKDVTSLMEGLLSSILKRL